MILNGLRQNEKPETNVKITGLNASTYKVKVIFENTALGSFDQTAYLMDGGNEVSNKEFSYSIELKKKGDWKLKPSSIADIPQTPVNTPDQVVYVFNPSGNATPAQTSSTTISTTTTTTSGQTETVNVGMNTTVTETPQTGTTTTNVNMNDGTAGTTTQQTTTTTTTGDGASVNMNAGGVGINVTIVDNMGGATSTTTTTTTTSSSSTTTSGTTQPAQPVQPVNTATQCYYPMSATDFANAKSSVEKQSFEDGKLKVAKQIMSTNCMSVAQVKEIMAMFSYEDTKLEWAKFAYGKTTDPNNYYQLNDGFTYSSSVDALNEYIETQKK